MDPKRAGPIAGDAGRTRADIRPPRTGSGVGLEYRPVRGVDEVLAAWSLVYRSYLLAGLIEANPFLLHTVSVATRPDSLTVLGTIRNELAATISAYPDNPQGLPLDASYPEEMAGLRETGHTLMEVGLLADRRTDIRRTLDAKLELMKWAYFYGHYTSHSDLVVGVHPHHAKFYRRMFGFEQFGAESVCPIVNDAPVVGLRLDLQASLSLDPMPRGIRHFVTSPVVATQYEGRYRLLAGDLAGTRIEAFLNRHRGGSRAGGRIGAANEG